MIIYPDLKIIYIRVPATGSTTFHDQMSRKHEHYGVPVPANSPVRRMNNIHMIDHYTIEQAKLCIEPKIWNSYEKIAFVRHPFWWARSIYRKLDTFNMIGIDTEGTFERYLRKLDKTPYFWFTDASGCVMIDTIYRTEDLRKIYEKYGASPRHGNPSPTKREYEVSKEVPRLLQEKFAREYEHYDKNDTLGRKWEGLNKASSIARR
jgi:hypothetical protein